MATNETQTIYCGSGLDNFHTSYKIWHGYISLIVCILGTVANTLNIIVLTRKEMRSPTNAILTGLAVADLAVMIEYIPYTTHDYILAERLTREQRLSYSWACFIKFHSIFAQVLHTISIWLTITLAVWRYIAVGYPQKNSIWCGMRTTIFTIITAYIVCILVVSPSFYLVSAIVEFLETIDEHGKIIYSEPLTQFIIDYLNEMANHTQQQQHMQLQAQVTASALASAGNASATNASALAATTLAAAWNASDIMSIATTTASTPITTTTTTLAATTTSPWQQPHHNITVYKLYHSDLALHNKSLRNSTFLIYSVLIKLIPCIALTILSVRLIVALLEAKRRRKMLTSNAANGMKPIVNGKVLEQQRPRKNSKTLEKEKQTDRTTRMLLAVLLLFLITEFPQGIMGLLNTMLGDAFLMQCYLKLSDIMDILALLNSSINFILYCSMSRQFRTTFTKLFRPKFLDKWLPVAQDDDGGNGANGRLRGELASKSHAVEQQCLTTQVTNV
ncbi:G-protein coupled receptor dmsr-1-like [Zeugodacus cucurbitae]|uniref:G-protein coupled receptor dmsr-1-like n=1 Tax=Zeugodacus cucurbitae TaxID=28588 RepID=UPI00059698D0|nr:G-protein coupled receptor dmsr-1-like [Zeugodacus cucurbitae]